ncbi:hypothetical protein Tco_1028933 [Tanacetum coccineum]|uniref:RNA-directed DNA polymerase, eukaryota n=1 Tax=Tanacetum coccineum TaxID=301880 RepID=A0ABQ5G209_9ASTR
MDVGLSSDLVKIDGGVSNGDAYSCAYDCLGMKGLVSPTSLCAHCRVVLLIVPSQRNSSLGLLVFEYKESVSYQTTENNNMVQTIIEESHNNVKLQVDGENDDDEVSEDAQHSDDPFGCYDLLKNHPAKEGLDLDPSLSHPPGFTPTASKQENNNICSDHQQKKFNNTSPLEKELSPIKEAKEYQPQVSRVSESSFGFSTRIPSRTPLNEGSILELLDDMIKVGQSMGYDMEGCPKDIERIIGSQGATDGVK